MKKADKHMPHTCSIYKYPLQKTLATYTFFEHGLKENERCIYVADKAACDMLTDVCIKKGIDVEKYIASKQLMLLDNQKVYFEEGKMVISKIEEMITKIQEQAMEDGYLGLRIAGELPLVDGQLFDSQIIFEYEEKVDIFLKQFKNVKALCHYDENVYPHQSLARLIKNHHTITIFGNSYSVDQTKIDIHQEYLQIIDNLMENEQE